MREEKATRGISSDALARRPALSLDGDAFGARLEGERDDPRPVGAHHRVTQLVDTDPKILDLVENERLVTDWPDWRGQNERGRTRVAWLLESVGEKTKVTLIHGGFSRAADGSDYPFGWGGFLERLKGVVETSGR